MPNVGAPKCFLIYYYSFLTITIFIYVLT